MNTREDGTSIHRLGPLGFLGWSVVIGVVGALGAVVFRCLIAFFHNLLFLGQWSLVYDANAKVQPEYDPKMIVLIRRVRVRPTLIFQGRVEGEMVAAVLPPPAPAPSAATNASKPAPRPSDSFVDRVRTFVRKLWSRGS